MSIDIVVLWVDGSDPAWLEEKNKYSPPAAKDSNSANRYRDWGLLPYWFRSIEKFAPWARKIHFVTWGHVPAFLNLDAPKLHVVKHTDFIPAEYLPTFSSHAIEMNIHRIPDLAEHFIYFNDDTFLLRPMAETDFFRNGLPCTCGREDPWIFRGELGTWAHAAANDLGVINRHFSKKDAIRHHGAKFYSKCYGWKNNLRTFMLNTFFPDYFTGFQNLHIPVAYRKQTFEEVWAAEPTLLDNTCRNRFRNATDVNQWVCLWWQVASGNFEPCCHPTRVMWVFYGEIEDIENSIKEQWYSMVCLNDPDADVRVEELSARVRSAFQYLLPDKCVYEK